MSDEEIVLRARFGAAFYYFVRQTMCLAGLTDTGKFLVKATWLYKIATDAAREGQRIAVIDDEGNVVREITGILAKPIDSELCSS